MCLWLPWSFIFLFFCFCSHFFSSALRSFPLTSVARVLCLLHVYSCTCCCYTMFCTLLTGRFIWFYTPDLWWLCCKHNSYQHIAINKSSFYLNQIHQNVSSAMQSLSTTLRFLTNLLLFEKTVGSCEISNASKRQDSALMMAMHFTLRLY